MKHAYFFSIIIFIQLLTNHSLAQSCLPDGITFTTQQEIDDFAANYPECTEVIGDVRVNSFSITSLSGLSQLNAIGGHLSIDSDYALTSLAGLENLTSIGKNLAISNAEGLVSLAGLENLTSIGENLAIVSNEALISTTGLENISSINGWVLIESNPALMSLAGLSNITSIDRNLAIYNSTNLPNLSGLDNLTSIGGIAMYNNGFSSLTGLNSVTSIGDLSIGYNSALLSLTGLENLTTIDSLIQIFGNDSLINLMSLENIDETTIDNLQIYSNPNLAICGLANICTYLGNGGAHEIYENATNCNSATEVLDNCLVSVNQSELSAQAFITPNPNKGLFQISGITKGDYAIFNTTGQLVQNGQLTNDLTIDMTHTPQGIYFIEIRDGEQVDAQRFIKQ